MKGKWYLQVGLFREDEVCDTWDWVGPFPTAEQAVEWANARGIKWLREAEDGDLAFLASQVGDYVLYEPPVGAIAPENYRAAQPDVQTGAQTDEDNDVWDIPSGWDDDRWCPNCRAVVRAPTGYCTKCGFYVA